MGASFQNPNPQSPTHPPIDIYLTRYEPICQIYDESLGKLKIYRKKEFNFDYVAVVDKLVQRDYVEELGVLVGVGDGRGRDGHLWVRVYGFQVYPTENKDENYRHIRLCFQYLNYTLKDYLSTPNPHSQSKPPYILSSILSAFTHLQSLQPLAQSLNLIPLLTSLTTPSLIFIDVEGFLKFLHVPIFMLTDYVTNVDKCVMNCCRFQGEGGYQYRNIVMPRFGRRQREGDREREKVKIEKIFMGRVTKLIKYLKQSLSTREEQLKTQPTNSRNIHNIPLLNNTKSQLIRPKHQDELWGQLDKINNMEQLKRYVDGVGDMPRCLEFSQEGKRDAGTGARVDKIKLEKLKLKTNYTSANTNINTLNNSLETSIRKTRDINTNILQSQHKATIPAQNPTFNRPPYNNYRPEFQYL